MRTKKCYYHLYKSKKSFHTIAKYIYREYHNCDLPSDVRYSNEMKNRIQITTWIDHANHFNMYSFQYSLRKYSFSEIQSQSVALKSSFIRAWGL